MRDLYKESKHQPGAVLDLMTATRVGKDAQAALDEVCRAGLGLTGSLLEKEARYHLWVGSWDSYTGGSQTVAVMTFGRAWCRETVCECVECLVVSLQLKKNSNIIII